MPPWLPVAAAWVVPAVLGAVDVIARSRLAGNAAAPPSEVLFVFGDWLLYGFLTPGVFVFSRRWPLAAPYLARHAILHLSASLAFCAAWAGAGTVLRVLVMPAALWSDAPTHFVSWIFITLPFGVSVDLAMVGVEHALRYAAAGREKEVQLARMSEQLSAARLAALQAQLNPHFLFNALNTIAVKVRDGDADAAQVVEHLGAVLRRILDRHRADEVALDDELTLVRQYLAIEQARFSDRLRVEFDIAPELRRAALPGFAVQHLVENAIRHGIAKRTAAGRLRVAARRDDDLLEIRVADDGVADAVATFRAGHGLHNTAERLRTLYGDRASLSVVPAAGWGMIATLRVPWKELAPEPDDLLR
jgi:hypothetical protein